MMKKILPAMIGAALAGGMTAAAADVTVFGHIDTSIRNFDADLSYSVFEDGSPYDSGSGSADDLNLVCTTCSIGFKGSEDLGNGLKAIFKLDFQYDTTVRNDGDGSKSDGDNNNSGLLDRDQWLGLGGGFGKVRIGTISTGYKSHGAMIDPLYRTIVQARGVGLQSALHLGAGEEGEGRATNTIRWDSPDFSGFNVVAHYTLDSDESDDEDNNPFGIGGSYKNGGILVFGDYLTNDGNGNSDQNELTAWKIGGKYTMNNFAVFGQYEDIQNDYSDGDDAITASLDLSDAELEDIMLDGFAVNTDGTVWHLGGTYTMGSNMLYAAFGQGDNDIVDVDGPSDLVGNVEYDTFTLAAVHSMSKRTSVYAAYNNVDASGSFTYDLDYRINVDAEQDIFTVGMKHKF